MANARLSKEKQAFILAALSEGMAINAVCRTFGVGKHAVLRVIEETGQALGYYMHTTFRGIECKRLALDEAWMYVGKHGQRMEKKERGRGDFWLWCGLDSDTKLIVSFHIGSRGRIDCEDFVNDLSKRVTGSPQITSDQFPGYAFAIRGAFGDRCSYATEAKEFVDKFAPEKFPTKRKNGIEEDCQG